jgi:serine/threonine protein kinase
MPLGYEVLDKLGEGGMGVVYKARRVALNRIEVVKMIRAGEFAGPKDLIRFRFEAEAAENLEHPNIEPVFSVGEVAGQLRPGRREATADAAFGDHGADLDWARVPPQFCASRCAPSALWCFKTRNELNAGRASGAAGRGSPEAVTP